MVMQIERKNFNFLISEDVFTCNNQFNINKAVIRKILVVNIILLKKLKKNFVLLINIYNLCQLIVKNCMTT